MSLVERYAPKPYDVLMEKLAEHAEKPYAIRMGSRDWSDLKRDPRAVRAMWIAPGDPPCFHGVPVRLERRRISGIKHKWDAYIYATAEELHEAIYGDDEH